MPLPVVGLLPFLGVPAPSAVRLAGRSRGWADAGPGLIGWFGAASVLGWLSAGSALGWFGAGSVLGWLSARSVLGWHRSGRRAESRRAWRRDGLGGPAEGWGARLGYAVLAGAS
jgi:hypothetical protein